MFRTIALILSFLSLTGTYVTDKPFLIMSTTEDPMAKLARLFSNMFSSHQDIATKVDGATGWKSISAVMKQDMNKVNALKNKDGDTLGDVLDPDEMERLLAGINLINHMQTEKGEIMVDGWFDIDDVDSDMLDEYIDAGNEHTRYTAARARTRKREIIEEKAMKQRIVTQQAILDAQLASAQSGGTQLGAGSSGQLNLGAGSTSAQGNIGFNSNQGSGSGGQGGQGQSYDQVKMKPDTVLDKMPDLTDTTVFSSWLARVNHLAKGIKAEDVLDATYVPSSAKEIELFAQRQNIMFLALDSHVKTTVGKTSIERHLVRGDAQQVIKELKLHYAGAGSIIAQSQIQALHLELIQPNTNYYPQGTCHEILEAWEQKLVRHDTAVGTPTPPAQKKVWFERFISQMRVLDHVANLEKMVSAIIDAMNAQASVGSSSGGPSASANPLTPDMVINLYKAQALRLDVQIKEKVLGKRHRIANEVVSINMLYQAYNVMTRIDETIADNSLSDDAWFHVYAMASRREGGPRPGFIRGDVFRRLTKEEKEMWMGFTEETRELILSARSTFTPKLRGPTSYDDPERIPTAPKSGTNPRSRYKKGSDPKRGGPVNSRARINTAERARVDANVSELRKLHIHNHEGLFGDSTSFIDSVRANQTLQSTEVNQTSHTNPFDPRRFMSQVEESSSEDDAAPAQDDNDISPPAGDGTGGNDITDDPITDVGGERQVHIAEEVDPEADDGDEASVEVSYDGSYESYESEDDYALFMNVHESIYGDAPVTRGSYHITKSTMVVISGMIDRGANGGVAGDPKYLRTMHLTGEFIDIIGIDNHAISRIPIGTVGGVAKVVGPDGPMEVLVVFHNYAILARNKCIHSAMQLEAFSNKVDDRAIQFGGTQTITTPEGRVFPLDISNGLVHLQTRAFTDDEFKNLPRVTMTSEDPWNPSLANSSISDDPTWYASQRSPPVINDNFDVYGEYMHRTTTVFAATSISPSGPAVPPPVVAVADDPDATNIHLELPVLVHTTETTTSPTATSNDIGESTPTVPGGSPPTPTLISIGEDLVRLTSDINLHASIASPLFHQVTEYGEHAMNYHVDLHEHRELPADFERYRRFFLYAPREVVQHTFDAATRYYPHLSAVSRITDHIRSHFPAANVARRHEVVGSDTIFFDIEAQGGSTGAQFFIGRRSYFMSIYAVRSDGEFINALLDEIRFRGAMDVILTDRARAEISNRVNDVLRQYRIRDHQSEPHYQQQNIAERFIQELKKLANRVLNTSGCPPEMIFHILVYVVFIWNRTARRMLGWRTPIEALTGQTPDISMLLHHNFWDVVYISNYQEGSRGFPSRSTEILCRFIGYAETVGHAMTFKVWNPATRQVLFRSRLRKATPEDSNHPANHGNDDDHAREPDADDVEEWHDDFPEQAPDDNAQVDDVNGELGGDTNDVNLGEETGENSERETGRDEDNVAARTRSSLRRDNPPASGTRSRRRDNPPVSGTQDRVSSSSGTSSVREAQPQALPRLPVQPTANPTVQDPLPPASEAAVNNEFLTSCIGRFVLLNRQEDGQRFRAKIVQLIEDFEGQRDQDPERIRFACEVGDEKFQEIVDYNDMCNFIEEQMQEEDGTWRFRRITGHSLPKRKSDKPKVLIEWESGEITLEPIYTIGKADPWMIAEYAKKHGLVDEWHDYWPSLRIKKYSKNIKRLMRLTNEAKRVSYKSAPIWQYGHQVPHNHKEAMDLDTKNGNTNWRDSEKLEKDQLLEYETFEDRGHKSVARRPGPEYTKIDLHIVYAVKHDGRFKSRIVAGGHMTDVPLESVYSGVVSLRGVRFVIFLAELNGLELYQTDVGNAYLESYTREKVYVIGGPELHELQDHVLIIRKALYGLKSSGLRWHERFADVLRDMGFSPCVAEPDIWMRAMDSEGNVIKNTVKMRDTRSFTYDKPVRLEDGSYYEYIAVYTDDLTIASKDPEAITSTLTEKYKFKLKGTGKLNFLLGCNYYREGKILCASPKKYIEKMEDTYFRWFGTKPSQKVTSPLEANDNPELDTSEKLETAEIKIYQSMIGSAQWLISLGRFDIGVHIMTLSSFRARPRRGHLDRIKRIYGYVCKMRHGAIRYRTEMPDVTDFTFLEEDWNDTPFKDVREEFPTNMPAARGLPVLMTTFHDANLGHDKISGKSVTGVLHYFNKTPIDWFTKKQGTVELATFGSENNAAREAVQQINANKLTLMYLGVPIHDTPILLGDNQSVVNSDTSPKGKLHKRHLMLSYNYVRENIAARKLRFAHIPGVINPSDMLSKHWAYQKVWPVLQPVLFWRGDTMKLITENKSIPSTK